MSRRGDPDRSRPVIGEFVEGIEVPVVNERSVRAAAGLLLLFGAVDFAIAVFAGDFRLLRVFGIVFLLDMNIRLFLGTRFSPSLALGALAVRRQRPEWVGASQKQLAWSIGLVGTFVSCGATSWFGLTGVTLAMCGVCLLVLFVETAFGICLGCEIQRRVGRVTPQRCPGDSCTYVPPSRGHGHSVVGDAGRDKRARRPPPACRYWTIPSPVADAAASSPPALVKWVKPSVVRWLIAAAARDPEWQ